MEIGRQINHEQGVPRRTFSTTSKAAPTGELILVFVTNSGINYGRFPWVLDLVVVSHYVPLRPFSFSLMSFYDFTEGAANTLPGTAMIVFMVDSPAVEAVLIKNTAPQGTCSRAELLHSTRPSSINNFTFLSCFLHHLLSLRPRRPCLFSVWKCKCKKPSHGMPKFSFTFTFDQD